MHGPRASTLAVALALAGCAPANGELVWDDDSDAWSDHDPALKDDGEPPRVGAAVVNGFPGSAVCNVLNACPGGATGLGGPVLCMDFEDAEPGADLHALYEDAHEVSHPVYISGFFLDQALEGAVLDHDADATEQGIAMAFDSSNPTGGDPDLGTPNEMYGGPGVGEGGWSNDVALGNLAILSEDGDASDPDDNAGGAVFSFDMGGCAQSVDLIDIDEGEHAMIRVDVGPADAAPPELDKLVIDITGAGNNATQRVWINQCGVHQVLVGLSGSGAVDNLVACDGSGEF